MSARLKLPAYAKGLLLDRRAGRHPLETSVVFGDRWYLVPSPKICIKPAEYSPGVFDFGVLAGLRVHVFDQVGVALDSDVHSSPPKFGVFYDLLAEVAAHAAWVDVHFAERLKQMPQVLTDLAWSMRWRGERGYQWPRWWSDALAAKHRVSETGWINDKAQSFAKARDHGAELR